MGMLPASRHRASHDMLRGLPTGQLMGHPMGMIHDTPQNITAGHFGGFHPMECSMRDIP